MVFDVFDGVVIFVGALIVVFRVGCWLRPLRSNPPFTVTSRAQETKAAWQQQLTQRNEALYLNFVFNEKIGN